MEYDLFEGSPQERWLEILFAANKGLVKRELTRILSELARAELHAEGEILEEETIEKRLNNLCIESMGNILSQHE